MVTGWLKVFYPGTYNPAAGPLLQLFNPKPRQGGGTAFVKYIIFPQQKAF
jgi:hypothetical protein